MLGWAPRKGVMFLAGAACPPAVGVQVFWHTTRLVHYLRGDRVTLQILRAPIGVILLEGFHGKLDPPHGKKVCCFACFSRLRLTGVK